MYERRQGSHKDDSGKSWNQVDRLLAKRVDPHRRTTPGGVHSDPADTKPVGVPTKSEGDLKFELDVVAVADLVARTVIKKQKDYGPNNIRRSPFGPEIGLIVRMYDKLARLANLQGKETPNYESLKDTYLDIAGYAFIGMLLLENRFPEAE